MSLNIENNNFNIAKSNRKIISSRYIKDNVFDNFDISDLLKKDLYIPKTNLDNFLYKNETNSPNLTLQSTFNTSQQAKCENNQEEIISEINNNNHFNIDVENLILTFKNGYKVPFINLYKPIKLIGQGHFGLVLSVLHIETNKKMAVKIIKKKKISDDYYLLETKLLKKLNHERIIKLYDVINTKKYLFIFTELCEGGSLKDFIISRYNFNNNYFIKDSECAIIIRNIIQGVEYLANNGIIHRDLKPENIMFRKENDINSLVLCDFGLAGEILGNTFIENKCGTLIFMAPEVIMNRPYDSLVDIWSIGIIMYILESGGSHPIYNKSMNSQTFIEFINNKNKINFPDFFPTVARNFFLKLCKYDPFFRYNVNKALNHPWIIRVNHKVPLTVIEDIEKENKIKNFKNMLMSFIFLKQFEKLFPKRIIKFKKIFENRKSTFINNDFKLNSPIVKLNKFNIFYNNINKETSKHINNLPLIQRPLSREILNKMHTSKSTKDINDAKINIRSKNLFSIEERKNHMKKIHLKSIKDKTRNNSQKDIFIKNNIKNSIDILKEHNSLIKIYPSKDKKCNIFKIENKTKKIKLNLMKDENEYEILKKISINSPKNTINLMTNEMIFKSLSTKSPIKYKN
jgi:serine/threonine protein kinase